MNCYASVACAAVAAAAAFHGAPRVGMDFAAAAATR